MWDFANVSGELVTDTAMIAPVLAREGVTDALGVAHPLKGLGKPEDIGKAAVFLASDDASWVTGVPLSVDGKSLLRLALYV